MIVPVIKSETYWEFHFAVIQALYPLYQLLCFADMKEGGIDKVKYYIMQVNCLLDDGIGNVCSKKESAEESPVVQKLCDVVCVDLLDPDEKSQNKFKMQEDGSKFWKQFMFYLVC